jgi:hypothetical protein
MPGQSICNAKTRTQVPFLAGSIRLPKHSSVEILSKPRHIKIRIGLLQSRGLLDISLCPRNTGEIRSIRKCTIMLKPILCQTPFDK